MKRLLLFLPILLICLHLVSFSATAEESITGELLVTEEGNGYSLYEYEEGAPALRFSGGISELLSYLGGYADKARITFNGVTVSSPIEFPSGEFTFLGDLTLTGAASLTVSSGTSLTFSEFSLWQDSSSEYAVRVKGGSLLLNNSTVISESATAILLDYGIDSTVILNSGRLSTFSDSPTVNISTGRFIQNGGSVENTFSAAINNDSLLFLSGDARVSGVGYDIVTEKPITLSYGGVGYTGANSLSVSYLSAFAEGSMTEIFYSATESAITRIKLYDKEGREYALTYMDKSPGSGEEKLAAVYLPHTVKLYHSDGSISYEYKLSGERLEEIAAREIDGYTFLGWFTDREGTGAFSFDSKITASISLYAVYRLTPPTFSISSVTHTYDKSVHELSFDSLTHPLLSSGGFFSYTWMRDGEVISTESRLSYINVSDSGEYSCKVVFHYNSDTVEVTSQGIFVTVNKKEVDLPTIPKVYYNGTVQTPTLEPSSLYSAADIEAINAGKYSVELTLIDPDNYRWQNTDAPVANVIFEIERAENRFSEELEISDIYLGTSPAPFALAAFGEVRFVYSTDEGGEYTERLPTAPGTYYVRAVVDETLNYLGIVSEPLAFTILKETVTSLSVTSLPNKTSYYAFEYFSPVGLTLLATYNSGRSEEVNIERVSFSYQSSDCFLYSDNGIVLSYGGVSTLLPITVSRVDYDLSAIDFSDFSLTFDGRYHTYTDPLPKIVGKDGTPLGIEVVGGGTNAGEYILSLVFSTDSQNYNIPKTMTAKMTVNRYKTDIIWENLSFTYTGSEHIPTATYLDVYGVMRKITPSGGQINAGKSYLATVPDTTENYVFENTNVYFEIRKADYNMDGVYWSDLAFIYDSGEKSVSLLGLPSGVSVVGYTDATATESGEYLATASLVWDSANYNPPPTFSTTWNIYPAVYDMSGVEFLSGSFTFDGNIHYPTVVGSMPEGLDGSSPTYSFSRGVTHVLEGEVAVTVSFTTDSKNYIAPSSITVYLSVTPRDITVSWQTLSFTYNGKPQAPDAFASECEIEVMGKATDAGDYTATATSKNPDYKVTNSTLGFTILKAENYWITSPTVGNIFEDDDLVLSSEAYTGEVIIYFFTDSALENGIEAPTSPGKYYAVFTVPESKNYLALTSPRLEFTITEVVPTSLAVEILKSGIVAFEKFADGDMKVTVSYNNGSTLVLTDPSSFSIIYENGYSTRKRDTKVTVCFENLIQDVPISVGYASYNPIDFVWESSAFVYDKSAHHPRLIGLPEGVAVTEYVGGGNINAGTYTVVANLTYDSENYNPPPTVSCEYRIERCSVDIPTFNSLVYNGKPQLPAVTSSLYRIEETEPCVNTGKYTLALILSDRENYIFTGTSSDTAEVTFEILPLSVSVALSDYDLYLFEKVGDVEYSIDAGGIIGDDKIEVEYYLDGSKIHIKSKNPNYTLDYTPAQVIQHNTLSYEARYRLFLIFLLLLVIVLLIIVIVTQRDRIKNAYAMVVCRYHNRNVNNNSQNMLKSPEITAKVEDEAPKFAIEKPLEIHLEDSTPSEVGEESAEKEEKREEPEITEDLPEKYELEEFCETSAVMTVDAEHADELITDFLAKDLVKRNREIVYTTGKGKGIINVDTLSENFKSGSRVDVNVLKEHKLISDDTAYLKVLARGSIDKPLSVYANDFSLSAVKMIALTGGEAVKVVTAKGKQKDENLDKAIEK